MLVIKIGGSLTDFDPLLQDVAACQEPLVLVHGANKELNELSTKLGHPPRMVTSERGEVSRFTDATTMDVGQIGLGKRDFFGTKGGGFGKKGG